MDTELDVYKLGALARDYRHAVKALSHKREQLEQLKTSQSDAEKAIVRLEEAQKKAEKAIWAYLLDL